MISPNISKIYINTGNLINCKDLNRRATQSPSEEVAETLKYTLQTWLDKHDDKNIEGSNGLKTISSSYAVKVDNDDRRNLKVSAKVFMETFNVESLNEAIEEVMRHLDVRLIDSLILALPNFPSSESLEWELIKPLWSILEKLIANGKIATIGFSDLDTRQLKGLYNWSQVKPSVNQVNLESCCAMPQEMTEFAKAHDIQLLTHNDPKVFDLLPDETFQTIFQSIVSTPISWRTNWMVRYSVIVKCRGIVQNKGYLLCASSDAI